VAAPRVRTLGCARGRGARRRGGEAEGCVRGIHGCCGSEIVLPRNAQRRRSGPDPGRGLGGGKGSAVASPAMARIGRRSRSRIGGRIGGRLAPTFVLQAVPGEVEGGGTWIAAICVPAGAASAALAVGGRKDVAAHGLVRSDHMEMETDRSGPGSWLGPGRGR
jgi:hypothetical protein